MTNAPGISLKANYKMLTLCSINQKDALLGKIALSWSLVVLKGGKCKTSKKGDLSPNSLSILTEIKNE